MNITKNFTLEELTKAPAEYDNTPGDLVELHLRKLAVYILQPLRDAFGRPVIVHSGYRCEAYNRKVGGHRNSEHLYGLAADIDIPPFSNADIIRKCLELKLPFQQIIDEQLYNASGHLSQWIHISWGYQPNRILKTARNTLEDRAAVYTIVDPKFYGV